MGLNLTYFFSILQPLLFNSGATPTDSLKDGPIRVVLPAIHQEYDPSSMWVTDQWFVIQNLVVTLLGKDDRRGYYGRAAKQWSVSPDGKTIEIELRPNLKFSNGDVITSDAVAYSLKRLILKSSLGYHFKKSIVGADYLKEPHEPVTGIRTPSANKIIIISKKPFINPLYFLSRIEFGLIHPSQVDPRTLSVISWAVSSGPYFMTRNESHLRLIRNPHYHPANTSAPMTIQIQGMTQNQGYKELLNGNIDILNFGAVFEPEFAHLENNKDVHSVDMGQLSSCYFQFNPKTLSNFPLSDRRNLFQITQSENWLPYPSQYFKPSQQLLTEQMPHRLRGSQLKSIETKWEKPYRSPKTKPLRIFYPEFFGGTYRSRIKERFQDLNIDAVIETVPIDKFMRTFNSDKWDLLFTMMEMPSGDIRTLFTQLFSDGGMRLADPTGQGEAYSNHLFESEKEFQSMSEDLAQYIHNQVLLLPLFQTSWPYYIRSVYRFDSSDRYELDFRLWKILPTHSS